MPCAGVLGCLPFVLPGDFICCIYCIYGRTLDGMSDVIDLITTALYFIICMWLVIKWFGMDK